MMIPRMQREVGKVSEDLWIYPLHSEDKTIGIAALVIMLLSFLLFITIKASHEILIVWAILTTLQVPFVLLKRFIEIDRKRGTINKWWQIFGFRRNKFYRLSDFNTLKLYKRVLSRYGTIPEYVIVFIGPSNSIKILVTRVKDKAKKYSLELAEFLGFELVDVAS